MVGGILSALAFVVGYIEKRIGARYNKIMLAAITIALFDILLTALVKLVSGFAVLIGLLILFVAVMVIELLLGDKRDAQYITSVGFFLVILLMILSVAGIVNINLPIPKVGLTISNILAIFILDVLYTLLGASVSTVIQSVRE